MKITNLARCGFALTLSADFAQIPYPGNDADSGVTRISDLLDVYTGNLAFSTHDLAVPGAVGQRGLTWARSTTSRTSQKENLFGLGHNWAHNWQWEMVAAGLDTAGRAIISVRVPGGWVYRFTQTSPDQWMSAPSVKFRLASSGSRFVVLHPDGGEVRFTRSATPQGALHTLTEITDAQGSAVTMTWEAGRLVQVTEPAGRSLKIFYRSMTPENAPANAPYTVIAKVVASNGQSVLYNYTCPLGADYPVLTTVTYADGATAKYSYAAPRPGARALLTVADDPRADATIRGRSFLYQTSPEAAAGQTREIRTADGRTVIQSLGGDSRGTRSYALKQSGGAIHYPTFNPGGNRSEDIDALGFKTKTEFDTGGRGFKIASTDKLGKTTRFTNDANGYAVAKINPDGSTTSWKRDARGRVLAVTDELKQTRIYTRDSAGRVTKLQLPDGSSEEVAYNRLGQVESVKVASGAVSLFTYDSRGLRKKFLSPLGEATVFAHDDKDRLAAINDARGHTTSFERDAVGRITAVIHADGARASVEYNPLGQITRSTDATGVTLSHTYDEFGRTTTSKKASALTRLEYAPIGSSSGPLNKPVRIISPEGRTTSLTYDANGQTTARTEAAGTNQAITTRAAYDANGRQTSVSNGLNKTTQLFYDDRGRLTKVMNALNHSSTFNYDAAGRKIRQTDAAGNTTAWTYDQMGRVIAITDAKNQVTRYTFNDAGQRVSLIDAKGNTYRFEYDLLNRQTAMIYPDGSRESSAYDAVGNKVRSINRAGTNRTFTFDRRNRDITSEWSDGSQRIVKAYDDAGRMILEDNGVSRLTYRFDAAGRLETETQDLSAVVTGGTSNPAPRTIRYAYTADGRKDALTYPDGSLVKYNYDALGQLTDISGDEIPPPIASYRYDSAGNATRMPRENQTQTEVVYDAANRVTEIIDRGLDSERGPLSELDYTYDEVGNRTSTTAAFKADGKGPPEVLRDSYTYDETYQVTGADYGAKINGKNVREPESKVRFTYDAVGNRITVNQDGRVAHYTTNALNEYVQAGDFVPAHDRNGNLAAMGQWLYRYDALNRLVGASNGQMTAKFYYDAQNRCVARSYNGTVTLNYYGNWNLLEECDQAGKQVARYVHGKRIDEIVVMVNQHGVFYPHRDVLGNVTMLTNTSGKLVERYTYTVEGRVAIADAVGRPLDRSAVANRWMFTGREWLAELGLYDYRNRVFSAQLGRFIQTDPIRFAANDVNIYRYVSNNLVNRTDPSGLEGALFGPGPGEPEIGEVGRPGSLVESGGFIATVIENFIPGGYTFGQVHDRVVGELLDQGFPDLIANVPTMPLAYAYALTDELAGFFGDIIGSAMDLLTNLWDWLTE